MTTAEINGDVQFSCTYSETQGVYGTVQVNNNLVASHTPATADANHTFSLVNGMLNVEVPNSAGNGTDYALENGVLSVNPGFTGSITAEYEFTTSPHVRLTSSTPAHAENCTAASTVSGATLWPTLTLLEILW